MSGRPLKQRLLTWLQRHMFNPPVRAMVGLGIAPPMYAILETTGRKSGKQRRIPVGNGLDGDTFWIVTEFGWRSGYVRNIEVNPRVRVKAGGRWRTGTAQIVAEDDPVARLRSIGIRWHTFMVQAEGTELMTVRIDLDR